VGADGRLGGEHHRRRPVEDRVRDIARLGARRLGVLDHRLEHLRRGDHRLAGLETAQDDPLLQQRHRRRTDLDAEIAAGDHHDVGLGDDVVEHVHGLRLSILAITCAVEPRAAISSFSSLTSEAALTNDSATKSTPSPSAKSRSSRSFSVNDGARRRPEG
jgi:hypothetical protein